MYISDSAVLHYVWMFIGMQLCIPSLLPSILSVLRLVSGSLADELWKAPFNQKPLSDYQRVTPLPSGGKIRAMENSGVCETVPNVYQASGYGDLSDDEHMWWDGS